MYGLNDAPLAWQLCVFEFLIDDLCAHQGLFDECFFFWFSSTDGSLEAVATAHVDDNALGSSQYWLDDAYDAFVDRFDKVKRQHLPFGHCGTAYSAMPNGKGYKIDQSEFCQKLAEIVISAQRRDEDDLTPVEKTQYRSQLGALFWVCLTRLDLVADVVLLV